MKNLCHTCRRVEVEDAINRDCPECARRHEIEDMQERDAREVREIMIRRMIRERHCSRREAEERLGR